MIEFVSGNFFDFDADVRVNTVNCVGVMGAGAALQFKSRFPKMYEEYVLECKLGKVKIGKPHVWKDQNFFNQSPVVINFPTKEHWKNPSEYEYVEKGLAWLRNYLVNNLPNKITIPALGCGHGGLDWSKVKPMIQDYLKDLNVDILVFEPESSTKAETSPELDRELLDKDVRVLLASDTAFPIVLNGKSATEIYAKGNLDLLNNEAILSILINTKASEREKLAVSNIIAAMPEKTDLVYLMSYNTSFEIDMIAKLIEKKANVILLIPYGILNLKMRKDIMRLWNDDRGLIISLSKPRQSWSAVEGIKGLKFKLKLSKAALLTTEDLTFFSKYEKDFFEGRSSYFYLNYWNEKPDFLAKIDAKKIGRDKETNQPKLSLLTDFLVN